MTRRIAKELNSFKYKGEPVKITLGTLLLTCFCILLLIIATFTQVTINHPYLPLSSLNLFDPNISGEYLFEFANKSYRYIPQIPTVFFIVALMGRKFGTLAICAFILLGMFFPIFALGGGISYLLEYGFGYILAFIPAIFFTGTLLKVKTDFLRIVLMSVLGVLSIHILGILYMLFIATLRHASMDVVSSWIIAQSGVQIFYDMFFAILAVYLGRWAKRILWLVMC